MILETPDCRFGRRIRQNGRELRRDICLKRKRDLLQGTKNGNSPTSGVKAVSQKTATGGRLSKTIIPRRINYVSRNDSTHHRGFTVARCDSSLAVQPFMGLWPERWFRTGADRGAHPANAGTHIAQSEDLLQRGLRPVFIFSIVLKGLSTLSVRINSS